MKSETGMCMLRVGLIGDYNPQVRAHVAIPQALALAAEDLGCGVGASWLATSGLGDDRSERLAAFAALWCVPASPYASMEGALAAIRFVREWRVPFLGTCGGFQHALVEYARNVLGRPEADHAETAPAAEMPLIAPLSCSLVGATGRVALVEGSRVGEAYGSKEAVEEYRCSYGFNHDYLPLLERGGLRVTGTDEDGEVRAVELDGHPFFVATLFQPELTALTGRTHPLVRAFIRAAAAAQEDSRATPDIKQGPNWYGDSSRKWHLSPANPAPNIADGSAVATAKRDGVAGVYRARVLSA